MKIVDIRDAETCLIRLNEDVEAGDGIVFARNGKPVAKLAKAEPEPVRKPRTPGAWEGKVWMAPDFDQVPDEVHRAMNLGEDVHD